MDTSNQFLKSIQYVNVRFAVFIILVNLGFTNFANAAATTFTNRGCPVLEGVSFCFPTSPPRCSASCSDPTIAAQMSTRSKCDKVTLCDGTQCSGTAVQVCQGKCYTVVHQVENRVITTGGGGCTSPQSSREVCTYNEAGPVCRTVTDPCTSWAPSTTSCQTMTVLNCELDFREEGAPTVDASGCDCSCPSGQVLRTSPPVKCGAPNHQCGTPPQQAPMLPIR